MKIAVTGSNGQIVKSLIEVGGSAGHEVIAIGRPALDLEKPETVVKSLQAVVPDVIVSAAAYTAVDKAESERELAFRVNRDGAAAVARAASLLDLPLIHISTDYVFDGKLNRPYLETDPTCPKGVYGATKLAGEQAVLEIHGDNCVVLRVAWVYSPFASNFVKTMLRVAYSEPAVSVVADQVGNPTSAIEIALGVLAVAENIAADRASALRGVFHMAAQGAASWADLAEEAFVVSKSQGGSFARVKRIKTIDYPTLAVRPSNSQLDCDRILQVHGVQLPHWGVSLRDVIARLQ